MGDEFSIDESPVQLSGCFASRGPPRLVQDVIRNTAVRWRDAELTAV
jgi:hypothetical protein